MFGSSAKAAGTLFISRKAPDSRDLYQIAGAYVSIGKYMNEHGRYTEALDTLAKALDCVN